MPFSPAHLLHGSCGFDHDQSLHYVAHLEELNDAVEALLNGEDFEFTFDLTEYDKHYIKTKLVEVLGPDFLLDFH